MYALGIDLSEKTEESAADAPEEIAALAQARWDAKKARDFAKADELRKKLAELGWSVLDKKDGFDLKKI